MLADETFTVSGSIQSSDGTPLSNVELGISNQDLDTQTDASGLYSANLASGLPYMLSTYKAGYIFSPQYHYVDSLSSAERVDFSAIAVPESNADPKCVFYYPNWAVYTRDFQVHDIPADYMSHINYAFLMPFVAEGSLAVGDPVAIRENRGGVNSVGCSRAIVSVGDGTTEWLKCLLNALCNFNRYCLKHRGGQWKHCCMNLWVSNNHAMTGKYVYGFPIEVGD